MVLQRILRAGEGRQLKKLRRLTDVVSALEDDVVDLSDADLQAKTEEFRARLADGETTEELLPEAFAVAREASRRVLGQRHFDVQVMGGAALHSGAIAEMRTGEGKTLTCVLPAYLNALGGEGVHVVTVNDYLARRDAEWMGRVHRWLGLSVGVILPSMRPDERRAAYACDITYGTNNELGFDYLRDNMATSTDDLVQRGHRYAVVDEVDSILIDEARTPLIISGPIEQSQRWYGEFARLAPRLERDTDYEVDEAKRTVAITEAGVERVEDELGVDNLYEAVNTPLVGYLNNALKAKELFRRDKDYVVMSGEVHIVDENTGRLLVGRRYNEGMHQAIEAKEGVEIKAENQTLATITLQNYFRLYEKLSGMTGTAMTEESEFNKIYSLPVVVVPTNREMVRADASDVVYKTEAAKLEAVVDDIVERHEAGQPVLVGTTSVEKSERLGTLLTRRGVPHEVLNAKNHAREAVIVAQAGRRGAVTVATNMAGRGTDIVLGGNPEFIAAQRLSDQGLSPTDDPDDYTVAWPSALEQAEAAVAAEHEEVVGAGGLYVLGTERHESRRIDNQLRGRSGRQGDPGESRFYLSLQDDLMRLFSAGGVDRIMTALKIPEDQPIEAKMVSRSIKSAQTQVEQQHFETRKNVLKYDEVLNEQRQVIYRDRRGVLAGADLRDYVRSMIDDVVASYVDSATAAGFAEDWDLDTLFGALRTLYPVAVTLESLVAEAGGEGTDQSVLDAAPVKEAFLADVRAAWDRREQEITEPVARELERRVLLSVLDRKWREHLYEMDYLKEGIGLRAMAQRDPLIEYQREGHTMFLEMQEAIKEESVGFLFHLEVQAPASRAEARGGQDVAASAVPAAEEADLSELAESAPPAADLVPEAEPAPAPVSPVPSEAPVAAEEAAQAAGEPEAAGPREAVDEQAAVDEEAVVDEQAVVDEEAGADDPSAAVTGADGDGEDASGPSAEVRDALPPELVSPRSGLERASYSAPTLDTADGVERRVPGAARAEALTGQVTREKVGRNAPCPCGSGKKYKQCHGRVGAASA